MDQRFSISSLTAGGVTVVFLSKTRNLLISTSLIQEDLS